MLRSIILLPKPHSTCTHASTHAPAEAVADRAARVCKPLVKVRAQLLGRAQEPLVQQDVLRLWQLEELFCFIHGGKIVPSGLLLLPLCRRSHR